RRGPNYRYPTNNLDRLRTISYLAAKTVISTIVPGVNTAPTAVRVGKLPRSTQAIHDSFISSFTEASWMYTVALRMRDLLVPAWARTASIFFSTCAVWPFISSDLSSATIPEQNTRSPNTAALQFHSRGLIRLISMIHPPSKGNSHQ